METMVDLNSKIVDNMLKELLILEKDVKIKQKRIEDIKKMCKNTGSFSTLNYVCTIKEQQRRSMVGVDKAIDLVGMDYLVSNNLLTLSRFSTVHVAEKTDL